MELALNNLTRQIEDNNSEDFPTDGYRLPPRVPRQERIDVLTDGQEDVIALNTEESQDQMTWVPMSERD